MKREAIHWSRRKFITAMGGTGALFALNPTDLWAKLAIDPAVADIVAKTIGIDTHNHIDVPLDTNELPGPKAELAAEMKTSGLAAICMTFATDYKRNIQPGEAYQRFLNGLTAMDDLLRDNNIQRSYNLGDIQAAHKKKQATVIQSIEGCHFLEGKIDRVEVAYKRGIRHLGLLHDSDAAVPLGDVYTNPATFGGLTNFGTEVIKACNKLGMLVDLAHSSNDTINAALKIVEHPVIISHTGLNTQLGENATMAKMMAPRLISKEQAKIVADAGGVIGVWTHLSDTPLNYAKNIRAMVDVTGIDNVCIGTDTKLTPPYRSPNNGLAPKQTDNTTKPNDKPGIQGNTKKNDGGPGGNNGKRIGERTNEAWADEKEGFYYVVVDALLKTGFNEMDIAKIGGANYLRIFAAVTKGH